MDPAVTAATIGLVGTIVAALIGLIGVLYSRERRASVRTGVYDKVTGSITRPTPGQAVGRTIHCSGIVTGLQPATRLWLAVESGGLVWPKESTMTITDRGRWSATIFEDGVRDVFAVALYVVDAAVNDRLEKWLQTGQRTGSYRELKAFEGARRLARVDDLRLEEPSS